MLIVRLVIKMEVTQNDRVCGGSFDVCKRRNQGALGAKKHGTLPPRQAPRGEGVLRINNLQML